MMRLNHRQAQRYIQSGEKLGEKQRVRLMEHLNACEVCRDFAAFHNQIEQSMPASFPHIEHTQGQILEIVGKMQPKMRKVVMSKRVGKGIQAIAWAGLIVLLVVGLGWVIRTFIPAEPGVDLTPTGIAQITPESTPTPEVAEQATPTLVVEATSTPDAQIDDGIQPQPAGGLLPPQAHFRAGKGRITQYELSNDARWVAVGSSAGVCLYEMESLVEVWCDAVSIDARGGVSSIAMNLEGTLLAAGTWNGNLAVWEVQTGLRLWSLDTYRSVIRALAWSPDGSKIAVGSDATSLSLINALNGEQLESLRAGRVGVLYAAWSPDGKFLAGGDFFGQVFIWDAESYERVVSFETTPSETPFSLTGLEWTADSQALIITTGYYFCQGEDCTPEYDGQVSLWDAQTGEQQVLSEVGMLPFSPSLDALGSTLAIGIFPGHGENNGILIDMQSGQTLAEFPGANRNYGLQWFPDENRLFLPDRFGRFAVINTQDGELLEQMIRGYEPFSGLAWSPDSARVAAISGQQNLVVYDAQTGDRLFTSQLLPGTRHVTWSPDGNQLATIGDELQIIDANSGELLRSALIPENLHYYWYGLEWSPDSSKVAAITVEGQLVIWNAMTWEHSGTISTGGDNFAWSPDGSRIAAGFNQEHENRIVFWDVEAGVELDTLDASGWVSNISWSAQGDRIATGSGGWLEIWDAGDHQHLMRVLGEHSWGIERVALSHDGELAASVAGEVILWQIDSGEQIATLYGLNETADHLSFSPDGTSLAATTRDGSLLVWDVSEFH
ncbi:MAG: WD40 repeat domain-containing protein [Anaerolineales bacterium]|nr:WD40 repeat domain-containing protein [Anaerolineales bacterium]